MIPRIHIPIWIVPIALVGVGVADFAWTRWTGRRRLGGILIAASLLVALPLAALAVARGERTIFVVTDPPPLDSPAWALRCDSAFQERTPNDTALDRTLTTACVDATRSWRWTAIATSVGGLLLLTAGVGLAVRGDRPEENDKSDPTVAPARVGPI